MKNSVLVVAAHPDDELLGCGGTLLRHVAQGDQVHIMILAEGLTSRDQARDAVGRADDLKVLHAASQQAADALGAQSLRMYSFPDNRMDGMELLDVVKCVEDRIVDIHPNIIYTHHAGDVNVDHYVTHRAVITAARSLPGAEARRLLFFETVSSTEWQMPRAAEAFLPNYYVEIGDVLAKKLELLHYYEGEMREFPHPRSYRGVEGLARYRGQTVGVEYAEAFCLGRQMISAKEQI